jgi:hypothetical protein
MEMTAMTAQVLKAIMIKMVMMIIKMNCNDDKINKLAAKAAVFDCKEHCIETAGYMNCEKCLH